MVPSVPSTLPTATLGTQRPGAHLETQKQRPTNLRCAQQVAHGSHCADRGRSSTWCPRSKTGPAVSLYTDGFGSSHTVMPPPSSWGLSTLALDENSCPPRAPTLPPPSGSLPREQRTQLRCVLCLGQSVVSLPASKESVPVSSAPATSPTPTGPSHHQTSGRAQTSQSPPPPCPWAASTPVDVEAEGPTRCPTFTLLS